MKKTGLIEIVGYIEHGTGQHQSNTVYEKKCIPTITTIEGGGTQQIKVLRKWRRRERK